MYIVLVILLVTPAQGLIKRMRFQHVFIVLAVFIRETSSQQNQTDAYNMCVPPVDQLCS